MATDPSIASIAIGVVGFLAACVMTFLTVRLNKLDGKLDEKASHVRVDKDVLRLEKDIKERVHSDSCKIQLKHQADDAQRINDSIIRLEKDIKEGQAGILKELKNQNENYATVRECLKLLSKGLNCE